MLRFSISRGPILSPNLGNFDRMPFHHRFPELPNPETFSEVNPTRHNLITVNNWTLFLLRTSSRAAAHLAGQSGTIPDHFEANNPPIRDKPPDSW